MHYLMHYRPDLGAHAEAFARDPEGWVARVHELKSQYFRRYLRKGEVPLRPGVARLIREADAAGLHVALVSNASRASLMPVLRYGLGEDLAKRIDLVVSGEDVSRKKPAPDGYLMALQRLGLPANECVALEDSAMGLRAAVAAGVPMVVTTNANTEGEDFAAAMIVLDSLGEPGTPARSLCGTLGGPCLTLSELQSFARRAATSTA
jgi:HAD superfamily hydrolase (TIGR01509 family)